MKHKQAPKTIDKKQNSTVVQMKICNISTCVSDCVSDVGVVLVCRHALVVDELIVVLTKLTDDIRVTIVVVSSIIHKKK